jgi:hypothetical protein
MSLLTGLTTAQDIKPEVDSVGTSGPLDSGIYEGVVTMAYLEESKGEALAVVMTIKTVSGREIRNQKLWVQSGKAKGKKNFYLDKENNKHYLPGFSTANGLALLTAGKELSELVPEEKTIKIYNFEAKADVPTKVQVLTELLDKEVYVGVICQTVDKNVKDSTGNYVPGGETRDENELDKFWRQRDKLTTAEILAGATEPAFFDTWEAKWTGVKKMKAKGAAAGGATAGKPESSSAGSPVESLFN